MKVKLSLFSFLLVGNLLFLIANIPLFLKAVLTPQNTIFAFVHHEQVDYYLYLSAIRAGMAGTWFTPAVYTSEATVNSLLYFFWLIVGHLTGFFNMTPIIAYHLTRIFSVELMLVGIYLICQIVVGRQWAFWAAAVGFLSTVPYFMTNRQLFNISVPTPWWSIVDPLSRVDYLPHHAFGLALFFITIYLIFRFINNRKTKYIIGATLTSFITGFIFPPPSLATVLGLPLTVVIQQVKAWKEKQRPDVRYIMFLMLPVVAALLSLYVIRQETLKGFPWSQWSTWDKGMWNKVPNFNRDMVLTGGFLLLISLPTIFTTIFTEKKSEYVFISLWAVLPYLLLPFTDLLNIGRIRLAYMGNFLPLGIIAVITIRKLNQYLQQRLKFTRLLPVCLIVYLGVSLPISYSFMVENLAFWKNDRNNYSFNTYIPTPVFVSMKFMEKQVIPYQQVILADFSVGNMLPAFAPVKSYFGHWTQTKDYWEKAKNMENFYMGRMDNNEANEFLEKGNISYIYLGPMERKFGGDIGKYNLALSEIYNYNGVKIFKVESRL